MVKRIISRRPVKAATDNDKDAIFKDKMDQVEDDFAYIQSGLDKMHRSGMTDQAAEILGSIGSQLQEIIADIADRLVSREGE